MDNTLPGLIAFTLVIIGALNWGLVALLDFDLVKSLCRHPYLSKTLYILVAVSGIYLTAQSFLK